MSAGDAFVGKAGLGSGRSGLSVQLYEEDEGKRTPQTGETGKPTRL